MANVCGVSFGVCLMRITRLDDSGNVIAGNNSYVTDAIQSVAVNPNIATGDDFDVKNGCGCGIASRKFPDTFKFWEFTIQDAELEPILMEFLLNAAPITNGADTVGIAFPSASAACDATNPLVAFEFWTENGEGSGLNGTYPYFHWVFPATTWQLGDNTFQAGPASPTLTGFSQTNQLWGHGPYGDGPPDSEDISEGGFWATSHALPTASCTAQAVTATS